MRTRSCKGEKEHGLLPEQKRRKQTNGTSKMVEFTNEESNKGGVPSPGKNAESKTQKVTDPAAMNNEFANVESNKGEVPSPEKMPVSNKETVITPPAIKNKFTNEELNKGGVPSPGKIAESKTEKVTDPEAMNNDFTNVESNKGEVPSPEKMPVSNKQTVINPPAINKEFTNEESNRGVLSLDKTQLINVDSSKGGVPSLENMPISIKKTVINPAAIDNKLTNGESNKGGVPSLEKMPESQKQKVTDGLQVTVSRTELATKNKTRSLVQISPFSDYIHTIYKYHQYSERGVHFGEIKTPNKCHGDKIYLHVGDTLVYDEGLMGNRCCQILRFKRDLIKCTGDIIIDTTLSFERDITVKHYDAPTKTWVRLSDDHDIFVKHDIQKSIAMLREIQETINRRIAQHRQDLEVAEKTHGLPAPKCHLQETFTSVPDASANSSNKYHHISNLPMEHKTLLSEEYVESSFSHYTYFTCFMCRKKVIWRKMQCPWTCSSVDNEIKALPGGGNYYLGHWRKHCQENNHCYFYFAVTEIKMEGRETTRVFIQRALFNAVKLFGGSIPLRLFEAYVSGSNPMLLMNKIALIMGAAIGGCKYTTSITTKKKAKNKCDIDSFKKYCSSVLQNIMDALLSFDYTSFINEGCTIHEVWNGINLFFRMGLYFDKPFPPIRSVQIMNTDISGFKEKVEEIK